MNNVLIVGAGQLGSRHLQALAQLDKKFAIYVIDPSIKSLEIAQQRYSDVSREHSPTVEYIPDIKLIEGLNIEVCVVATNAAIRFELVKKLTQLVDIKYLILEKVLFQSISQLDQAKELLKQSKIKTWVNCPRRQFPAYQDLAKKYQYAQSISLHVIGKNWGLACNAIHFIDLLHYLTNFSQYSLNYQKDVKIIDSKRAGYKEIVGGLDAHSDDQKHHLFLTCEHTECGQVMLDISVEIDGEHIELLEREGIARWLDKEGDVIKDAPLKVLFQSQLTHKVVLDLIERGECELTPISISAMLHREFLEKTSLLFTSEGSDSIEQVVPIT
ncbi:Gfo/Idh/MocA family oxidoreductase [Vibrio hepatarius]|uniref:Gfo/Idh/MocA-like oxidoreductase N-terminal domain-containing protein n=1 Tax=Vibrio hepatarius TaxID=171383 RepID=A0A0M0HX81_9VIBR|nr:Gfo/Idh/MocA family oxidoreductase [Vibrio hepatarius]KOO06684.1 hypothetical protein AKJ31_15530 [Vibrio hepatarius]